MFRPRYKVLGMSTLGRRRFRTSKRGLKGINDRRIVEMAKNGNAGALKELKRRQREGRHVYLPQKVLPCLAGSSQFSESESSLL